MKLEWNKDPEKNIIILSIAEFIEQYPELYKKSILRIDDNTIRFCRIIDYQDILSGTFLVPVKQRPIKTRNAFAFCLADDSLFFIGEKDKTSEILTSFQQHYDTVYLNPILFLIGFMLFMIHDDVYFLEQYDLELEQIEERLFVNNHINMEQFTMETRRDMEILSAYYVQLRDAAETLQKNLLERSQYSDQVSALLNLYLNKVSQLQSMVETIKNYTSQIWNLRQTQLSDKQNKITTVLTIITTIFLPLTLIAGWFGMNFQNLPLIYTSDGYTIIFVLCVLIILVELVFIWTRHLFK